MRDIINRFNRIASPFSASPAVSSNRFFIKEVEEMEGLLTEADQKIKQAKELEKHHKNTETKNKQTLLAQNIELTELNFQLNKINDQLKETKDHLVKNEKLASIGQLAAGIAQEINHPIAYIFSNFGTLERHLTDFIGLIQLYTHAVEKYIPDNQLREWLITERERIDVDYIRDDMLAILRESQDGMQQISKIALDLKYFSHTMPHEEWQWVDITRDIEAALNIILPKIKPYVEIIKELNPLPKIQCFPSQLNQVFMNILMNAVQSLEDKTVGTITIRTAIAEKEIWVEIEDTGCGIAREILGLIFDPFFTTRPVGKGSGLGLSLSYGIIQKHQGRIDVYSEVDVGTCFRVTLPMYQSESKISPAPLNA